MRVYIEIAKNAFQSRMAYKMNTFLRLFRQVLFLIVQVSIWTAIMGSSGKADSVVGTVTLQEMVTYTVLSAIISIIIDSKVLRTMDERISSGQIAMDLIKPMNHKGCMFSETLGNNLFEIVFDLIPLILVSICFYQLNHPVWYYFVIFILALVNAKILYFLMLYIVGMIAFWYMSIWHLEQLLGSIIRLFSGALIPLWFFPQLIVSVCNYLPFKLIYFTPITIYLGKMNLANCLRSLIEQWVWIGILLLVEKIVWSRGINKLVVQGG